VQFRAGSDRGGSRKLFSGFRGVARRNGKCIARVGGSETGRELDDLLQLM
jgi:hypothetical protein